ncbi:response regulator transcription factor [Pseudomonas sp. nanlin1]|uniref:response regulator transcription factor n=1 Tax=Pseudomonas sp. nanlin1 TaxID=3040605 RepID=UPI003890335C
MSLLYITDSPDAALVADLMAQGYATSCLSPQALPEQLGRGHRFILLDLPRLDAQLLARCVVQRADAAVLVLLEHGDPQARIEALRGGAELCLTRPVPFSELQARLHALHRDHSPGNGTRLWLSHTRLTLGRGNRQQPLTVSEHRLLAVLAREAGAVSREVIERHLWGACAGSRSALIERHVCNLRRKLDELDAPNALQTWRGVGYSLREPVDIRV